MRPIEKEIADLLLSLQRAKEGWLDQAARDATEIIRLEVEIERLRAANTELREVWLKQGWRPMEAAPRDGTVVDLWGNNRGPDGGGILLPMAATEGRYTSCFYGAPYDKPDTSALVMPRPEGWYRVGHSNPGDGLWFARIWPTHWRPVPGRPV